MFMKSAKLLIAFAGMSLCLTSCVDALNTVTNEPTDYDKWIASENKKDYNGDEKIDNTDYLIYVAFTNWLEGNDSIDYNGDRKINYDDYSLYCEFKDWVKSNDSLDFNSDSKINIDDYYEYLKYVEWKNSKEAIDLNKDNVIGVEDYDLFNDKEYQQYLSWKANYSNVEFADYLKYLDWSESERSEDLNGDRIINYNDYLISLNPQMNEFDKWLSSSNASDYNKDGKIDNTDFIYFNLFGSYSMKQLSIEETGIYLTLGDMRLSDLENYLNDFSFDYDENGVTVYLSDSLTEAVSDSAVAKVREILNGLTLVPRTENLVNIDFRVVLTNASFDVTFNLSKNTEGDWSTHFEISITLTSGLSGTVTVDFVLVRK